MKNDGLSRFCQHPWKSELMCWWLMVLFWNSRCFYYCRSTSKLFFLHEIQTNNFALLCPTYWYMLAFVTAMIVCYLKPKLRARVVLLLLTILVIAMRSGQCYDTGLFFICSLSFFNTVFPLTIKSRLFQSLFYGHFSFQQYHHFFYPVLLWIFRACFSQTIHKWHQLDVVNVFLVHVLSIIAISHHSNNSLFYVSIDWTAG